MEREREKERDSFGILYTGYLLREWKEREREVWESVTKKCEVNRMITRDLQHANLKSADVFEW